jgi:GNAT superfamily N-acetyltransferase
MPHTQEELFHALELDMLAHHVPFAHVSGSRILAESDCFCYESPINFGAYGGVLSQHFTPESADLRIAEINRILRGTGKDLGWVVSPIASPPDLEDRLTQAGGESIVELQGMALDFKDLATPPHPANVTIHLVEDELTLEQYARIYPLLYHVPVEEWIDLLVEAEKEIFRSIETNWHRWIAHENGNPVAAARTGQKDGIAALQILCTLPEYRNRGIGQALATHALLHEACETGILWAGPGADRLYSRMGFKKICRTAVYVFS